MVLWEITLGTAYFLGLKRTYRLALKIQRRIVGPKHPKIRSFLHRRTRAVFDVAVKVHKNIQDRDIEVGRNLGNWILRYLDRMKPSAQIRVPHEKLPHSPNSNVDTTRKLPSNTSHLKSPGNAQSPRNHESDRRLFTSAKNLWPKSLPTVSTIFRPWGPSGSITQHRRFCSGDVYLRSGLDSVIRKDIKEWMLQS